MAMKWETRIRKLVGMQNSKCPIVIVDGEEEPKRVGNHSYYTNKKGESIRNPNAYSKKGWSDLVYHKSTLRITVGREWLLKNLTNKELLEVVEDRLLQ